MRYTLTHSARPWAAAVIADGYDDATSTILRGSRSGRAKRMSWKAWWGGSVRCGQAARAHLGIATLPCHLASHPTYGAGLVRVLAEWKGAPVNVFAMTADRKLPAKLEELIRVTRSEFPKDWRN